MIGENQVPDKRAEIPNVNFLYCNHPLYKREVDEDYQEEYRAAGMKHPCALFSYEDLEIGKLSLYGDAISGLTIYRGWMMKPELYDRFYSLLEKKGIVLINTPEEYRKYHLLPGWYHDFECETASSVWEENKSPDAILELIKSQNLQGPYMVKDFVKSRKHEWYDACFIENIREEREAGRIIGNFVERQERDLVGGIVLRKFERFKQIGVHEKSSMPLSEEYRVFVLFGNVLIIDDYWRSQAEFSLTEDERDWIASIAKRVKSPFVSVDLARKEDGSLMILEFGDGQVSGLQQINPSDFYKAIEELLAEQRETRFSSKIRKSGSKSGS